MVVAAAPRRPGEPLQRIRITNPQTRPGGRHKVEVPLRAGPDEETLGGTQSCGGGGGGGRINVGRQTKGDFTPSIISSESVWETLHLSNLEMICSCHGLKRRVTITIVL